MSQAPFTPERIIPESPLVGADGDSGVNLYEKLGMYPAATLFFCGNEQPHHAHLLVANGICRGLSKTPLAVGS